ncbi:hypothetical protein DPMN_086931 [Dreissena polymorpha]|uniref:Uncharacterized protein n=1 Tax=Dreissena polymorpha TaxID=45954 RepID=A0A9D4KRT0_DREPO|nr:hypothetical protein DPMN_086931 [Dreissena polymorpha]
MEEHIHNGGEEWGERGYNMMFKKMGRGYNEPRAVLTFVNTNWRNVSEYSHKFSFSNFQVSHEPRAVLTFVNTNVRVEEPRAVLTFVNTNVSERGDHYIKSRTSRRLPDSLRQCQDRIDACRRLPGSLRRCQDRLGTCTRIPYSLRRCQTVSQTGGAHAGDSQTVCDVLDGAKTILAPAGDPDTVYDGARKSLRPAMHLQETPRLSATVRKPRLPDSLRRCQTVFLIGEAAAGDFEAVCHGTKTVCEPVGDSQTIFDGANAVWKPAGDSQTVFDAVSKFPDRRVTRRRLLDSLRRCQDRLGSRRRLPGGARSLRDRQGTFGRIPDSPGTSRILKDGLRRCQYRLDRRGTLSRPQESVRRCQTVSQTGGAHARDSHTFCDEPRPSGQLQETPRQSVKVPDSLSLCRRLFGNLLHVPRRSLNRRRLFGSLVQVPRRSERLSDTVWESPAGVRTVLAPS